MNFLRRTCAASVLSVLIVGSVFAGQINSPGIASPPPPPPETSASTTITTTLILTIIGLIPVP